MDFLTHLWLPILLSGVGVWIASAVAWMAIGHHTKDRDAIPGGGEQEFMDTITRMNIPPGNYGFPDFCQHHNLPPEERRKAMKALYDKHPQGLLRVWAPVNMGANMLFTFLFYLVTSTVIAYLGWAALGHSHGAASGLAPTLPVAETGSAAGNGVFWKVFQITGTAGILAYCFASFPGDLWFQTKRRAMLMNWIDGVVFGLITGAIFAWLWPK
jgi:hypothetical protein